MDPIHMRPQNAQYDPGTLAFDIQYGDHDLPEHLRPFARQSSESSTGGDKSQQNLNAPFIKRKRETKLPRGYRCTQFGCNKAFDRAGDLRKHEKTHVTERPHLCPACQKGFLYPKDVKRHEKTVHRLNRTSPSRDSPQTVLDPTLGAIDACADVTSVDATHTLTTSSAADQTSSGETLQQHGYIPLNSTNEIRILTVHPGEFDDGIRCTLSIQSLGKAQYEALSYTWGAESPHQTIVMNNDYCRVQPNLYAAIRRIRDPHKERSLWVDALCINQEDMQERSQQVALMGAIYNSAQQVLVWLGEHEDNSPLAMDFASSLANSRQLDIAVQEHDTSRKLSALVAFMNRPWFSRRWIVQEIVLAKEAHLVCGDRLLRWMDFELSISILQHQRKKPRVDTVKQMSMDPFALVNAGAEHLGAARLIRAKRDLCRTDAEGNVLELLRPLRQLVVMFDTWSFTCADPRDRIYALLGLASDVQNVQPQYRSQVAHHTFMHMSRALVPNYDRTAADVIAEAATLSRLRWAEHSERQKLPIRPDYTMSISDLCQSFFELTCDTQKPGHLDSICRPWTAEEGLPSWVPDLSNSSFKTVPAFGMMRQHADPLINFDDLGMPSYNACGSLRGKHWRFPEQHTPVPRLIVTGFTLDTLAIVCDASQRGNIPETWLKMGGLDRSRPTDASKLWRTLVADRGPGGRAAPIFYERAFRLAVDSSVDGIDTTTLKECGQPLITEFLERMETVVWNRRLCKSETLGSLCLCPDGIQRGDLICVLAGLSVPIVLRHVANEDGAPQYRVIGECYVHGMMDGQALYVQEELLRSRAEQGQTDREEAMSAQNREFVLI